MNPERAYQQFVWGDDDIRDRYWTHLCEVAEQQQRRYCWMFPDGDKGLPWPVCNYCNGKAYCDGSEPFASVCLKSVCQELFSLMRDPKSRRDALRWTRKCGYPWLEQQFNDLPHDAARQAALSAFYLWRISREKEREEQRAIRSVAHQENKRRVA